MNRPLRVRDPGQLEPGLARDEQAPWGELGFVGTLLAATFLMGSSFVAGKILLEAGVPAVLLVGWRFMVAALATLPLMLLERRRPGAPRPRIRAQEMALVVLIGLIQTSLVMVLLFLSMRSISASTAAILLFTNPIWVAVLGRIFLRETLDGAAIAGLGLGVVGVALAVGLGPASWSSPGAVTGELTAVASAMCWAVATIITKRAELPLGSWTLTFWQMLIGSTVVLALAYATGERWPAGTTLTQWGWFLWLAIPSSTGSFGLWFAALAKGGATRASSYLFLAPLLAVITSFLVLGTTLSWLQGLGGALIGLAIWLINRERRSLKEAGAEGEP